MKKNTTILLLLFGVYSTTTAQVLTLPAIIDSIKTMHPVVKMYDYEIRSLDEAAKGARSWMPPEFSTGWWMTPYNPSRWKKMPDGSGGFQEGMGQFMIGGQQMFPVKKKQQADVAYMQSVSMVEKEKKNALLNELISDARQVYYEWIVLQKKNQILDQDEQRLSMMIRNAEIRYKNGLEKINAYYKAKAALGSLKNMQLMVKSDIREKRIALNSLMGRNALAEFEIDTAYQLNDYRAIVFDSLFFYRQRSDLKAVDQELLINRLQQETEKQSLRPQFGIRFEHMIGFGGLPMQFSLMGMMKLPLASWSSRMNKANVESLKWKANSLQAQKEMMVNEYSGMAYRMRNELELKKMQLLLYETKILPALHNNYKTMQLAYEQNTEELFMLFDAWETLNKSQLEYTDLLDQALRLQVAIERLMQVK